MDKNLLNDIIQWDVKSWKPALEYWDRNIDWSRIGNALELGGREGGLSLWLALKGISTVCSDIDTTQETAQPLHNRHNISNLISYQDIDAIKIPYENHFDLIVFKSIMGGVGGHDNLKNQQQAFHQIYKALKPGGKLLFAENLVASPLHQMLRKRFINWGHSWRYVTLKEMHEFLAEFSSYKMETTGVLGTLGRTEPQRNFLATIDKIGLNKLCPQNWHYISYGIAIK